MVHSAQSTVQQFLLFSSPRHHKSNGLIHHRRYCR